MRFTGFVSSTYLMRMTRFYFAHVDTIRNKVKTNQEFFNNCPKISTCSTKIFDINISTTINIIVKE